MLPADRAIYNWNIVVVTTIRMSQYNTERHQRVKSVAFKMGMHAVPRVSAPADEHDMLLDPVAYSPIDAFLRMPS